MSVPSSHKKKLYKYYFFEIAEPVYIEAYNKSEARAMLNSVFKKLNPAYQKSIVIGETVIVPVIGTVERTVNGKVMVWVGTQLDPSSWMEKEAFFAKYGK